MPTLTNPTQRPKAIALLSGGLDSALAARLVLDQGVDVVGLYLASPFGCRTDVEKVAQGLGITLVIRDKGEAYLDLIESPQYGYGSQMNPCIDCRMYMFNLAEKVRIEQNADFIITGEVLGQRPMSQQRNSIDLIDRKSEMERKVLRPLSAHLFPETIAESMGWVNREHLLGISGRSRKEQMALAQSLELKFYASPGGGCALTEAAFSNKLRDFFKYPLYEGSGQRLVQSELLRVGRHFRVRPELKVIVARDEADNIELEKYWESAGAVFFKPEDFLGPSAVAIGKFHEEDAQLVGSMMLRYTGAKRDQHRQISVRSQSTAKAILQVEREFKDTELEGWRL